MSRGKYLSLEAARNYGDLEGFVKEHPSKGNRVRFNRLLREMSKTTPSRARTSSQAHDASSNETQTRRDISKDAGD